MPTLKPLWGSHTPQADQVLPTEVQTGGNRHCWGPINICDVISVKVGELERVLIWRTRCRSLDGRSE